MGQRARLLVSEHPTSRTPVIDIELCDDARNPYTQGVAYLNGQKIQVMFDTGCGPFIA